MLDQNTTTIITSAFTVIGTLGGAFGGIFLSNRFSTKLEKLRIEEQKAQDRTKRDTAIIEEVYTILMNITTDISTNIEYNKPCIEGKQLQDNLRRLQILVFLYLPSLREKLDEFMRAMFRFSTKVNDEQKINIHPVIWNNIQEAFRVYNEKMNAIKSELEKLVR